MRPRRLVFLSSFFAALVWLVALEQLQQTRYRPASMPLSLPYWIALGMDLHNLGEGLSIGADPESEHSLRLRDRLQCAPQGSRFQLAQHDFHRYRTPLS